MGKKIQYEYLQQVGNYGMQYISEAEPFYDNGRRRRGIIVRCHCGKQFKARLADVKNNKTKSCNCGKGNKLKIYQEGNLINGVKFIKSLGTIKYSQYAIFECPFCKTHWKSSVNNIQAGKTKSCCGNPRGWTRTEWINFTKKAILYKVRLFNEVESFIKIGMTSKNVHHRMKVIPYKYEILKIIEGTSEYIFDLENRVKRFFKRHKYNPLINFKGEGECFRI